MINVTIAISSETDQLAAPSIPDERALAKLITLKELAALLKMDRSAARRYVMRLGYVPKRARTASSGYQTALVFTPDQVRQIVQARTADGYC
ncbi:TPA: hypothetical protein ACNVXO_005673 [Pseudomonas aeruginosa]|nr:hypothetical protein [Pseudomonas aeruginosa]ELL4435558.1 hypothetical protein [Pseudomonas aeruginosa]MBY5292169.1 hypothetical protein [Pseudomonas aeruginosa]MCV6532135.1 hypothetical protein [Pseudomonas aeruginosa]MDE5047624.1 hypothetical protein [Pseudomonas aeruginosa]MDY1134685.1 hypothetical protein [Pseudomonas aeruginosa]